jgi:hypothetical protein
MPFFVIAEAVADQRHIPYWLDYLQAASQPVMAIGVPASGLIWMISRRASRQKQNDPFPMRPTNKPNPIALWIFGLTVIAAAIGWAGLLFGRGDQWASITVLILLSLIIAPISLIILYREIVASLRKFNPKHIVYADYGRDDLGFRLWEDTGRTGEMLAEYLKELFKRPTPEQLMNELLTVPRPPDGPHQRLRFKLLDGRCFFLHEYSMITVDSARRMPPFQPTATTPLRTKETDGGNVQNKAASPNPRISERKTLLEEVDLILNNIRSIETAGHGVDWDYVRKSIHEFHNRAFLIDRNCPPRPTQDDLSGVAAVRSLEDLSRWLGSTIT